MDSRNIYFIPRISEHNFPRLKALLKEELPATSFSEFEEHRKHKKCHWSTEGRVIEIEVDPNNFLKFCATNNKVHNGRSLQDYVDTIGNQIER